ncbi:hypothetical protein LTR85_003365 [Meristemomyces frigidus]|nr:hypothetical protein LTR85_003365 [Meristemomyces frigidus]
MTQNDFRGDKMATEGKERQDELSLLLDLPAELRNLVYEMVLQDHKVKLSRTKPKQGLTTGSALQRVSKQVRNEFMAVVWLLPNIHTPVEDFSFAHIVTFLNRLSEIQMSALPTISAPSRRNIIVKLRFSMVGLEGMRERMRIRLPEPMLERWLKRTEHPTKRGTKVNLRYELVKLGPRHRWLLSKWAIKARVLQRKMVEGRKKEEYGKILAAILTG